MSSWRLARGSGSSEVGVDLTGRLAWDGIYTSAGEGRQESTSRVVPVPLAFLVSVRWPEISITARGRVEIRTSVSLLWSCEANLEPLFGRNLEMCVVV